MSVLTRLLIAHSVTLVAGSLVLWWLATPLRMDDVTGLGSYEWGWLLVRVVSLGVLVGIIEGLLARHGRLGLAFVVVTPVGLYALWVTGLYVADLIAEEQDLETDVSALVVALIGWAVFAVLSLGVALAITGRPTRAANDGPTAGRH